HRKKMIRGDLQELHIYPARFLQPDPFEQLFFALRYEGLHLELLKKLFYTLSADSIEQAIKSHNFHTEARKLWYLYEMLTGKRLALTDTRTRPYCSLVDRKRYYTGAPQKSRRHRVIDNLLGNALFCPLVRKTAALARFEKKKY